METERQTARTWITDGIIIASITALSYLFSFAYEAGYCRFFNIPIDFVSLSLTTIFVTAGALVVIVAFIFAFISMLYMFGAFNFSTDIGVAFSRACIFALPLFAYILLYGKQWREWIWISSPFIFFVFFDFVFPLIAHRGKGSYLDKLVAHEEASRNARSVGRLINTRFGNFGAIILLGVLYGLLITYTAGRAHAQQQKEFQVIAQSPDMPEVVILRVYGDYLFAAPFNRSTKEVEKKFFILKISEIAKTLLTTEKVGPLQVKP